MYESQVDTHYILSYMYMYFIVEDPLLKNERLMPLNRQLYWAAYDGNIEQVKFAIEQGADVNHHGEGVSYQFLLCKYRLYFNCECYI